MTISVENSDDGNELMITIDGRFDCGLQNQFRKSYEGSTAKSIVVDLAATDYMDSSALGMLLMMREHTGAGTTNIVLKNCSLDIKTILSIANFQGLFEIS